MHSRLNFWSIIWVGNDNITCDYAQLIKCPTFSKMVERKIINDHNKETETKLSYEIHATWECILPLVLEITCGMLRRAVSLMNNTPAYRVMRFSPCLIIHYYNSLRPRQDGRHFPDYIFQCIFLNENVWFLNNMSLNFVPKSLMKDIPALVQIMAWRSLGDKPLSEPMMFSLPTHICVTRPHWVKSRCTLLISDSQQKQELITQYWNQITGDKNVYCKKMKTYKNACNFTLNITEIRLWL